MRASERAALAAYLTEVADALISDGWEDAERKFLTGYSSAHLASLAGFLKVAGSRDVTSSIEKDRVMFANYVARLKQGGR